MLVIPLNAVPAQRVSVTLALQPCSIKLYQKTTGLFIDLSVNDTLIIGGVICEDRNRIVRDSYLGFIGDLEFIDTQGLADPDYTGLGSRFLLVYLETTDL